MAMNQELWDRRYTRLRPYGTAPNDFLVEIAPLFAKGMRVLFLGDGDGRNSVWLAETRGCQCIAVDWSGRGLEKAIELAKARGVPLETHQADVEAFDPPRVQGIVNIFCAVQRRRRVHQRCLDALEPGGLLVVELFGPGATTGPRDGRVVLAKDLVDDLTSDCEVLVAENQRRIVKEGRYHASSEAQPVARLVARKKMTYRHRIDAVFTKNLPDDSDDEEEPDLILRHAAKLIQLTVNAAEKRCRYCWQHQCACVSDSVPFLRKHCVVMCHPLEFLRSTSSGRLAAELGADFRVWGATTTIDLDDAVILYPSDDAEEDLPMRTKKLIALDGSWTQTAAMLAALRRRRPTLKCVALKSATIDRLRPSSKLIDAIRPGAGKGRLSTFEALCLSMAEQLDDDVPAVDALAKMDPLIRAVSDARPHLPPSTRTRHHLDSLALSLQRIAPRRHPDYTGIRSCPLCRVTLASPNRMPDHVAGRRHCLAVASAWSRTRDDVPSLCDDDDVSRIFDDFSTTPLLDQSSLHIEPPDLALASLQAMLADDDDCRRGKQQYPAGSSSEYDVT